MSTEVHKVTRETLRYLSDVWRLTDNPLDVSGVDIEGLEDGQYLVVWMMASVVRIEDAASAKYLKINYHAPMIYSVHSDLDCALVDRDFLEWTNGQVSHAAVSEIWQVVEVYYENDNIEHPKPITITRETLDYLIDNHLVYITPEFMYEDPLSWLDCYLVVKTEFTKHFWYDGYTELIYHKPEIVFVFYHKTLCDLVYTLHGNMESPMLQEVEMWYVANSYIKDEYDYNISNIIAKLRHDCIKLASANGYITDDDLPF